MTTLREDVYPDLVAHFYSNGKKENGDASIISYVKGIFFTLNRTVIRQILGIRLGG